MVMQPHEKIFSLSTLYNPVSCKHLTIRIAIVPIDLVTSGCGFNDVIVYEGDPEADQL